MRKPRDIYLPEDEPAMTHRSYMSMSADGKMGAPGGNGYRFTYGTLAAWRPRMAVLREGLVHGRPMVNGSTLPPTQLAAAFS